MGFKEQIDDEIERNSNYINQLLINKFNNQTINITIRNFPAAVSETDMLANLSRIYPSKKDFLFVRNGFLYNQALIDSMLCGIKKYYKCPQSIILAN